MRVYLGDIPPDRAQPKPPWGPHRVSYAIAKLPAAVKLFLADRVTGAGRSHLEQLRDGVAKR